MIYESQGKSLQFYAFAESPRETVFTRVGSSERSSTPLNYVCGVGSACRVLPPWHPASGALLVVAVLAAGVACFAATLYFLQGNFLDAGAMAMLAVLWAANCHTASTFSAAVRPPQNGYFALVVLMALASGIAAAGGAYGVLIYTALALLDCVFDWCCVLAVRRWGYLAWDENQDD